MHDSSRTPLFTTQDTSLIFFEKNCFCKNLDLNLKKKTKGDLAEL